MKEYELKKQIADIEFEREFIIGKINSMYDDKIQLLRVELNAIIRKDNIQFNEESKYNKASDKISNKNNQQDVNNYNLNINSFNIKQAEALDWVNYFGIIDKKQIMFCTSANRDKFIFLFCKSSQTQKYGLSDEGVKYQDTVFNRPKDKSCYIAQVNCIQLKLNDEKMWTEIYKNKLFPFWNPIQGPFKFNKSPKKIALCKVYKIDDFVDKFDFTGDMTHRVLKIEKEINLIDIKHINEDIYNEHSEKIISILQNYNAIQI